MSRPVIAIAGNPNSGKTTLFNALTGANAKVGNYPGITVERREGALTLEDGSRAVLMDVPGTYSLSARTAEEQVAITAMAGLSPQVEPDLVLMVLDATQLARNLYLLRQVLELRLRVVVALNMSDVVERHHLALDADELSRRLGVPVVPVSALRRRGLDRLRTELGAALAAGGAAEGPSEGDTDWHLVEPPAVATAVEAVAPHIPAGWSRGDDARRRALASWALLSIGENDELWDVPEALRGAVVAARNTAEAEGCDLDLEVVGGRYRWIDTTMEAVLREEPSRLRRMTDVLDRVLIHPAVGLPLFLVVMAVVFESLFSWSAPLIDGVDAAVGAVGEALGGVLPEGLVREFLVDGVIAGVGAVLVFLPQILMLFLFISIMEDSGYMARVAFLMDRVMRAMGLTGRAFVPMLSGFACAIPAVMATRTMERRRDRMLTMMVVPLTTCSARLPVYTLIIAALYPAPDEPGGTVLGVLSLQGALMVAMYLFGTVVALLAAAVLGRVLFRSAAAPLVLELPPYRLPGLRSVLRMMWERGRLFVSEAGTVILACTVVLWVLLSFPRDGAAADELAAQETALTATAEAEGHPPAWIDEQLGVLRAEREAQALRSSYGGRLGRLLEPALSPLGYDWKIGVGLVGAFAAREVFVSTMGVVYGVGSEVDEEAVPLRVRLQEERWPDGRRVYTPLVGLSLMVFFALAAQCMSTLAVVKRETHSWRWPVFLFTYMTVLAWVASFVVYQGGRLLGFT